MNEDAIDRGRSHVAKPSGALSSTCLRVVVGSLDATVSGGVMGRFPIAAAGLAGLVPAS